MANDSTNGHNGTNGNLKKNPRQIFADGVLVDAAIQDSLRQVRILHKKMGVALVGTVDGKLVSIPPEEIQIDVPVLHQGGETTK